MTKPFFSVCVPTRNRLSLLKEAVESILGQNYKNYEIIVQDNASSDKTKTYCQQLSLKKIIRYYRNPANIGFVKNIQEICKKAKGKYIFLLGDDDLMVPSCLFECHRILKNEKNNIGALRTNVYGFYIHKNDFFRLFINKNRDELLKKRPYSTILDYFATFISGWVFKNKDDLKFGNGHQDVFIETAFDLLKNSNFYYLSKLLVGSRVHSNRGYTFYSHTSPWFELENLIRRYATKRELNRCIVSVKYQMINDCHNIKLYSGVKGFINHIRWFFTDPVPEKERFRLLLKFILLLTMPNFIILGLRKILFKVYVYLNRNKFKEVWV